MPIRPIDMATVAPRSQETANQQLSNQHRSEQAQANLQNEFAQQVKDGVELVIQSSKSENTEYRYDAKEKGNGSYSQQKKKRRKQKKQENAIQSEQEKNIGSGFDIKI